MEVDVALQCVEVDSAVRRNVDGVVLVHQVDGPLDDAAYTAGTHEHVVGLLFQHEVAGAAERVECRLSQRPQLVLAVTVGEVGEHEEAQPVGGGLVEGTQDPGPVGVT